MSSQKRRSAPAALLVLAAVGAGACGGGEPGPTAAPERVVAAAPDITFATTTAAVATAAPGVSATGRATFNEGRASLSVAPRSAPTPFGVEEPVAVVDLVRGVVTVKSYGGAEVQGVGTKRYELIVDVERALQATPAERHAPLTDLRSELDDDGRVWLDVFVDSDGRIRRALVPVDLQSDRPFGRDRRIPALVSVDFYEFGESS